MDKQILAEDWQEKERREDATIKLCKQKKVRKSKYA